MFTVGFKEYGNEKDDFIKVDGCIELEWYDYCRLIDMLCPKGTWVRNYNKTKIHLSNCKNSCSVLWYYDMAQCNVRTHEGYMFHYKLIAVKDESSGVYYQPCEVL